MQNLNIHLCTDADGNLISQQVCDSRNILHIHDVDVSNFVGIEYLVDYEDRFLPATVRFKCDLENEVFHGEQTIIPFPSDGMYTYYKFLVPTLLVFSNVETNSNNSHLNQLTYDLVSGQTFFYQDTFRVMLNNVNQVELSVVLENSVQIEIFQLWNYTEAYMFAWQKIVFSFCELQKCLLYLQSQIINNTTCNKQCETESNTNIRYHRDFLLNAVYLLDYLVHQDRYIEAHRILTNLQDCSGQICKSKQTSLNSTCHCG